jgi:class 3 adenylate cyclase
MGTTVALFTTRPDDVPGSAEFYAGLAASHTVIRYDARGYGMSDRESLAVSVDTLVADLTAVIDAVAESEVTLMGVSQGGQATIRYAADHPERILRLVLMGAFAEFDEKERATARSLADLTRVNWGVATKALSEMFFLDTEQATREFAERQRQIAEPEAVAGLLESNSMSSVRDDLRRIVAPTLIIHSREDRVVPFHHARELAASIADARLFPVGGDHSILAGPYRAEALRVIEAFMSDGELPNEQETPSGFQTILFTDLESSTALTQRLGDEGAQELLRGHNATVRAALEEHGGREVKHTGDGIMASFPSAVAAVTAGLAMQRDLVGAEVRVRVGINAGEPIAEDDDLFGTAVQLAARITDRAEPGQVLVSDVVRQLCAGKTFEFTSAGNATLKGFDEPVTLYEARV